MSTGIRQHATQRIIGGARVAFDPRGTKKAHESRDPENYKATEKFLRNALRIERLKEQQKKAAGK